MPASGSAGIDGEAICNRISMTFTGRRIRQNLPAKPLGVKVGAFAACVENVAFFAALCRFAGVKEGDSTFRAFRDLQ